MKRQRKHYNVYTMWIAGALEKKGHKVIGTIANPKNPNLLVWIFETDDTFIDDFAALTGREWDYERQC